MEWFGWAGTLLFICCYVPQIYRTKKRRQTGDVSIPMWLIQWSAYTSCLVYSFSIMSRPLIFGYAMGWLMTAWFLELVRQYKKPGIQTESRTYIVYRFSKNNRRKLYE